MQLAGRLAGLDRRSVCCICSRFGLQTGSVSNQIASCGLGRALPLLGVAAVLTVDTSAKSYKGHGGNSGDFDTVFGSSSVHPGPILLPCRWAMANTPSPPWSPHTSLHPYKDRMHGFSLPPLFTSMLYCRSRVT
jgi:hypothetical protein